MEAKYRNTNLDLLKALSVFLVIVAHFGQDCPLFVRSIAPLAVPIFMILSFYFFYQKISTVDLKKRICRLFVPLIGWGAIYFIIYYLLSGKVTIYDFLWQITTGHSPQLNPSMWFSNNLIILTIVLFVIFKKLNKYFWSIMLCLLFSSYFLEYSGISYELFSDLRYELKYPLGRLIEMIPFMVTGIVLARYNVFNHLKWILIPLWLILFYLDGRYFSILTPNGFGYSGIKILSLSVLSILIFASIPQSKGELNKILSLVGRNTLGIYCIHRLVDVFLYPYFFVKGDMSYCFLVYLVSYLICFGISKIPLQYVRMLVK